MRRLLSSASRAANPETPVALTRWSAFTVISYSFRRTDSLSQLPTISRETPARLRARSFFLAVKTSAPWSGLPGYPVLSSYRFTVGWGSLAGCTAPFSCIVTCTYQSPGYRIRLWTAAPSGRRDPLIFRDCDSTGRFERSLARLTISEHQRPVLLAALPSYPGRLFYLAASNRDFHSLSSGFVSEALPGTCRCSAVRFQTWETSKVRTQPLTALAVTR